VAGAFLGPIILQSGSGAPELLSTVFPDLHGQPRKLADWKGTIAVCNFWATWCAPCREEIPLLVRWHDRNRHHGAEVVGIGIDKRANIAEFSSTYKISYPLLIADVRVLEVMRALGNTAGALPYTVVLDRAGALAYRKLGTVTVQELDGILARLLR
jgi:thiol-disulfide isomerase/thioredoxin